MLALTMASDAGTSEYGGSQSTITQSISARGASDGNHRGLGESDGTDTVSVSSRQTVHRGPIQEFNAWDRDGNFHRMRKAETVVSEARTTTTSKTTTATQSNGWAKTVSYPVTQKYGQGSTNHYFAGQPEEPTSAPSLPPSG